MNPTYFIYLFTFLGFPILGLAISRYLDLKKYKIYLKWAALLFIIHNILFTLGFSIKGDYTDYFIFSFEYLFLSITIALLYRFPSVSAKLFRVIGTIVLVLGFIQGLIGILMFIVISQDYEADRTYNLHANSTDYQTRRYSFGFATLDDTRYTFETYLHYKHLPFEKLINKTHFFELKTDLNFRDDNFVLNINASGNNKILEFSSANGEKYARTID